MATAARRGGAAALEKVGPQTSFQNSVGKGSSATFGWFESLSVTAC